MRQHVYILWDAAHIWGLMAWRTLKAMQVPCQLIKAKDIAQGVLSCKPPALLLAPGGTARRKVTALGLRGVENVRAYVAEGGRYLGFCGGAGLGLDDGGGLALCAWKRAGYADRMQHLVSGHVRSRLADHALCPLNKPDFIALPVWWPGRFAPHPGDTVEVLATYECADTDLCLADIPLASLPPAIFTAWQDVYGVDMRADFLQGQPCVLTGTYGKGRYILSYSHLETPGSPAANAWLAHLLREWAHVPPACDESGVWDVENFLPLWPRDTGSAVLFEAQEGCYRLMLLGVEHNLLFRRTSWLYGWRTGIPGAALNNLHTALCTALSLAPTPAALHFWEEHRSRVQGILPLFLQGVEGYLLAERLATTLSSSLPDVVDRRGLKIQRESLFGLPMEGGGLYQDLLDIIDELVFLLA